MREMEQNDVYDESEFEEGEDLDVEAEEDTSTKITSLWGIPVKGFILGGVIVLLIIIAIIVIAMKKNGSSGSSDVVLPNTAQTTARTQCYANFVNIGYTEGVANIGSTLYALDGSVIGTIESSGATTIKDDWGSVLGYVTSASLQPDAQDTVSTSENSTTSSDNSDSVDDETVLTLRKYGYTGDEIELAISAGANTDELIDAAKALQDVAAKEALERMSDTASEEFQLLVNTTQYCMPLQEFLPVDVMVPGFTRVDNTYLVNADYEKIPTYGYQLRVKVKIANGTYAFMDINPTRYAQMPDSGNIVVEVHYTLYGPDEDHIQFYITDLVERDITTLTVNPEDSAVNLDDVINKGR